VVFKEDLHWLNRYYQFKSWEATGTWLRTKIEGFNPWLPMPAIFQPWIAKKINKALSVRVIVSSVTITLPKIRHTVCQLSGISTCCQVCNSNNPVQYRLRQCWCMSNTFIRVPPSKFMATADYYYLYWELLANFFCTTGLKNCWHGRPGIEPTTFDLSSQSGAYDLSATATPCFTCIAPVYV